MILHRIADKIIFNILKKINIGYLEITSMSGELLRLSLRYILKRLNYGLKELN